MHRFIWLAIATCIIGLPGPGFRAALAGEPIRTLVASDDWIAQERRPSMNAAPDLCFAFTTASEQAFALRLSGADIDLRYSVDSWVLPPVVSGTLVIDIGAYHSVLKVSSNTTDTVTAVMTREDFQSMLAAMEKAGSLTIKAGIAPPRIVSLHGSNKATDALLACAGTIPKGEGGHSNP
jgi:hypothetical protein